MGGGLKKSRKRVRGHRGDRLDLDEASAPKLEPNEHSTLFEPLEVPDTRGFALGCAWRGFGERVEREGRASTKRSQETI